MGGVISLKGLVKAIKRIIDNDYLFSIVSKVSGVILGVIYSSGYNRFLGAELRGDAAIINNYVGLVGVALGVGIYQAYPYFKKNYKTSMEDFINNISSMFLLYLLISILIAVFTGFSLQVKIIGLMIPISIFVRQLNYVIMIEYPKRRNLTSIFLNIFSIIVIFILFFAVRANYYWMVFVLSIELIVNVGISFYNLRYSPLKIRIDFRLLPKLAKYGFIPMLSTLLMTINYKVDVVMLENNVPKSDIGIYALGVSLAERVWLIPDAVKDIMVSKLAKGKDASETARVLRCGLFAALICTVLVVALGKPFFWLLYGKEFDGSYYITIIMLIGIIGMIFYKMVYSYNVINGNKNINFLFLSIAAIVNIVGNFFLIPIAGIYAAALVSVLSYSVCGIQFLVFFHKHTSIKYREMLLIKKQDLKQIKLLIMGKSQKKKQS